MSAQNQQFQFFLAMKTNSPVGEDSRIRDTDSHTHSTDEASEPSVCFHQKEQSSLEDRTHKESTLSCIDVEESSEQDDLLNSIPRMIRLDSDAGEDMLQWYAQTFNEELTELKESLSVLKPSVGSTSLELMVAKNAAASQLQVQQIYETRLQCVEEMETLRLRLSELSGKKVEARRGSLGGSETGDLMYWDRDSDCNQCFNCETSFSLLTNRRHHCRRCGHIFCRKCCPGNNVSPIPRLGFMTPVRHCITCLPFDHSLNVPTGEISDNDSPSISTSSGIIETIRLGEKKCLENPNAPNLVETLQAYMSAIEWVTKDETWIKEETFRKHANGVLNRSMRSFLNLPGIQVALESNKNP